MSQERDLSGIRRVRLWHYTHVLENRHKENDAASHGLRRLAEEHKKTADFHMSVVQALNDFFPDVHDVVTRDYENEEHKNESL